MMLEDGLIILVFNLMEVFYLSSHIVIILNCMILEITRVKLLPMKLMLNGMDYHF